MVILIADLHTLEGPDFFFVHLPSFVFLNTDCAFSRYSPYYFLES